MWLHSQTREFCRILITTGSGHLTSHVLPPRFWDRHKLLFLLKIGPWEIIQSFSEVKKVEWGREVVRWEVLLSVDSCVAHAWMSLLGSGLRRVALAPGDSQWNKINCRSKENVVWFLGPVDLRFAVCVGSQSQSTMWNQWGIWLVLLFPFWFSIKMFMSAVNGVEYDSIHDLIMIKVLAVHAHVCHCNYNNIFQCLCCATVFPLTLSTPHLLLCYATLSPCACGFLFSLSFLLLLLFLLPPPPSPLLLLTTESRLAQSPPQSLGSACRRPTPTTSEASGWPWPRSLASRATSVSISHATRWRRQQQQRPSPMRVEKGGGGGKMGLVCFYQVIVVL